MYKAPIEITFDNEQTIIQQIADYQDSLIYKAVVDCNIQVDRDELIKALAYDRGQYETGYQEGYIEGYKRAFDEARKIMREALRDAFKNHLSEVKANDKATTD